MVTVKPGNGPITESNLRSFFHDSLQQAAKNQQVHAEEATIWYLANLLNDFSRSENLFDLTENGPILRPLAELYAEAAEAASETERKLVLQRLGDVALFVSGLFSGIFSRRRRLVDVDYYIAMGGGAYACLCETRTATVRDRSLIDIFQQLSRQFVHFVDVLAEVGENATGSDDRDILRMYEVWTKTGSPRLERRLRRLGITPAHFAFTH